MTVTVDTNVLIAAFVARGVCHDLFEHLVRYHTVVCSERILGEYRRVLLSKFGVPEEKITEAEEMVRSRSLVVESTPIERICRDLNWPRRTLLPVPRSHVH